jgi:hypothetical protein
MKGLLVAMKSWFGDFYDFFGPGVVRATASLYLHT